MVTNTNAQQSIERVLARLDQGEELICDSYYKDGKYCAMGILVDEANLFDLPRIINLHEGLSVQRINEYVDYYGLHTAKGEFEFTDVTPELQTRIKQVTGLAEEEIRGAYCGRLTLTVINDSYFYNDRPDKPEQLELNSVIAAVIRSGAIFQE